MDATIKTSSPAAPPAHNEITPGDALGPRMTTAYPPEEHQFYIVGRALTRTSLSWDSVVDHASAFIGRNAADADSY